MVTVVRRLVPCLALVLLALGQAAAQEQQTTITGRVVGAAGTPLAAADVRVPSLYVAAVTRDDGTYSLILPAGRVSGQPVAVTARMLGYKPQSVQITLRPGSITQDFTLVSDPLRLDELVVTGAGTEQTREKLGTALTTVDASTIKRTNESNVVQALAGKVPNVLTNQASGDAGASTSIQIRGAKTFGTSQPTIYVDGVPVSNVTRQEGTNQLGTGAAAPLSGAPTPNRAADINTEDIESIEILKGASAASIYGVAAGSAGAILITTKKGRPGRTQFSLRSTMQFDEPVRTVPVQRQYGVGSKGASSNCPTINCSINSNFFSWGPQLAPGTTTYDHGAEIFETGHGIQNDLTLSGGSDRATFYISAGQLNQDGFVVSDRDSYQRYTARFSGSLLLGGNLTISATGQAVQTKTSGLDRGNSINGIGIGALRQPPDFNAHQYLDTLNGLHRSWRFPNPGPLAFTTNRGFDNPFYALYDDDLLGQTGRAFGTVNANWKPLLWLQVNWTLGGDYNSDDRTYGYGMASSGTNGGSLERWQFYDRTFDHTLTATGTRQFSSKVQGALTVGQNLNETYFRQVDVQGQVLLAPEPFKLQNTTSRTTPNDQETRRRLEGYFAQANLDLYDQLFLQGRIRNDGNSAFGVGHQRAWYPGGSAAWSFSKAVHLPEAIVSFGKVRLAYGESGQQPPLYATQDVFVTNSFADFNPGSLQGTTLNGVGGLYASGTKGNPDIKPERVKEFEGGVDLSLFRGRADLSVTRYDSKSQDVVFSVNLVPSTGFTLQNINAGALTNKGWELTASVRALQKPDLSIDIGANWAQNRNLVTGLGATASQIAGDVPMASVETCGPEAKVPRCQTGIGSSFSGQTTHAQIGYPLGVWRANDFARCGRGLDMIVDDTVGKYCQGQPDGALYISSSGFPIMDPNVRAIGNPWPDWTAGISLSANYKGFQLSAFLDHRQGGDVLNMTRSSMDQYGTHKDTEQRAVCPTLSTCTGNERTFGKDMTCYNKTCDVLNGPVVGPGAGKAVPIGENWFTGLGATGGPITTRLEDGTFTRLREVSVMYSFRGPWVNKIVGMQQLDVKVSGRNLKLWTDYSGYDPEINLGGAQNANRGIDWFNAPLARTWVMQLTFYH